MNRQDGVDRRSVLAMMGGISATALAGCNLNDTIDAEGTCISGCGYIENVSISPNEKKRVVVTLTKEMNVTVGIRYYVNDELADAASVRSEGASVSYVTETALTLGDTVTVEVLVQEPTNQSLHSGVDHPTEGSDDE